jgi:hypothetical protein
MKQLRMKQKPDRDDSFCWFFCFQPCSGLEAVKAITPLTQVITDLITVTVPGHTTEEAQSWSRSAIDLTIVVPVTGMDARITSGNQVTGHGGTVSKSGSVATTSSEDTEPRVV